MTKMTQREHDMVTLAAAHLNRALGSKDNGVLLDLTTAGTLVQAVLDAVDQRDSDECGHPPKVDTALDRMKADEEEANLGVDEWRAEVARGLRMHLRRNNVTQRDAAEDFGCSMSTINRVYHEKPTAGDGAYAIVSAGLGITVPHGISTP